MTAISFMGGEVKTLGFDEALAAWKKGATVWFSMASNSSRLPDLIERLEPHPLVWQQMTEDKSLRSKIFPFDSKLFIRWELGDDGGNDIKILLAETLLLTIESAEVPDLSALFSAASRDASVFERGVGGILYKLLDRLTDGRLTWLDEVSTRVDQLEDKMFGEPDKDELQELFSLKGDLLKARNVMSAQREVVNTLLRHELPVIETGLDVYFQDLFDHLIRVTDSIDLFRDVLSGAMDIYLSSVNNNTNEVMKTLTIIATIMLPLSLIAGIYGMNFRFMPELHWRYGYFYVLGSMAMIGIGMLLWFRRRGWLAKRNGPRH